MSVSCDHWLSRIARLNVYRAKGGPAPHKPLLLLVVLDLAEEGLRVEGGELRVGRLEPPADGASAPSSILDPRPSPPPLDVQCSMLDVQCSPSPPSLPLTPELAFRFCTYWGVVAHRRTQRPDVRLPFHHLQSDGFWTALTADGQPSPDPKLTRLAALDPEFLACARDAAFRDQARRILIAKYFPPHEHIALFEAVGLPVPAGEELAAAARFESAEQSRTRGREARFRLVVVAAYNYTCALTGYRLTTITAGSIVDAAHIHQFADSRNNAPDNGMALSKNAHWLFDNGLWTLDDEYRILVAPAAFDEASPDQKPLGEYQGQHVRLPQDAALWPNREHVGWHRRRKFVGE
jgi:putative restriction endonuclease